MFRILICDTAVSEWRDSGEGPWEDPYDAIRFAHAEVGLPWIVVAGAAGTPYAYGTCKGVTWTRVPMQL